MPGKRPKRSGAPRPSSRRCSRRRPSRSARPSRTASAQRTTDASRFERTAVAGRPCRRPRRPGAPSRPRPDRHGTVRPRRPAARAVRAVRRGARRHRASPPLRSAPATIASGAWSPPMASIAIVTAPSFTRSLDLDDLAPAVPAAVGADRVGQPGSPAVGAQRVRRRLDGVVRRTPGSGAGPAHLALGDGQRRLLEDREGGGGSRMIGYRGIRRSRR